MRAEPARLACAATPRRACARCERDSNRLFNPNMHHHTTDAPVGNATTANFLQAADSYKRICSAYGRIAGNAINAKRYTSSPGPADQRDPGDPLKKNGSPAQG